MSKERIVAITNSEIYVAFIRQLCKEFGIECDWRITNNIPNPVSDLFYTFYIRDPLTDKIVNKIVYVVNDVEHSDLIEVTKNIREAFENYKKKMFYDTVKYINFDNTELKPCPFCGGKADIVDVVNDRPGIKIICNRCGISTKDCFSLDIKDYENMIELWNRRVK